MSASEVDIEDMMPNQPPRRFVDRQVPIGVILVVCVQIATGIWFASAQNSTIKQLIEHSTVQDMRIDKIDTRSVEIEKSVAILKDRSDDNLETSHRIEEYLHAQRPERR